MIKDRFIQKTIDEVDAMRARVQELARHYRDTEYGYHFGLAEAELDRAVVLLAEELKQSR